MVCLVCEHMGCGLGAGVEHTYDETCLCKPPLSKKEIADIQEAKFWAQELSKKEIADIQEAKFWAQELSKKEKGERDVQSGP